MSLLYTHYIGICLNFQLIKHVTLLPHHPRVFLLWHVSFLKKFPQSKQHMKSCNENNTTGIPLSISEAPSQFSTFIKSRSITVFLAQMRLANESCLIQCIFLIKCLQDTGLNSSFFFQKKNLAEGHPHFFYHNTDLP